MSEYWIVKNRDGEVWGGSDWYKTEGLAEQFASLEDARHFMKGLDLLIYRVTVEEVV